MNSQEMREQLNRLQDCEAGLEVLKEMRKYVDSPRKGDPVPTLTIGDKTVAMDLPDFHAVLDILTRTTKAEVERMQKNLGLRP